MNASAPSDSSRRRFLKAFSAFAAAAIPASMAALAGRFLLGVRPPKTNGRKVFIGPVSEFAKAESPIERILETAVADGYLGTERRERIFVVRDGDKLKAFSATCTHLGCGVSWDATARLFRCPCHGGAYRRDGTVAGGPPPRRLATIPIVISGSDLTVILPDET